MQNNIAKRYDATDDVRTIKVLRMQPSDGEYDIRWRSYMFVKIEKRLNT